MRPCTKCNAVLTGPTTKTGISTSCNAHPPISNNIVDAESSEMEFTVSDHLKTNEDAGRLWDEFLRTSKATLKKLKNTKKLPQPARDAYKQLKDSRQKSSQMRKMFQDETAKLQALEGHSEMYFSSRIFTHIEEWQRILSVAKKYELQDLYTTRVVLGRANPDHWQPMRLAEWLLQTGENIAEEEDWATGKVPLDEWEKLAKAFNLAPSLRHERAKHKGAAVFLEETQCGKHYFAGFPPNRQDVGCSPSVKSRVMIVDPLWS